MSHSTQPNVTLCTHGNWWLSLKSLENRHLSQVEVLASWILLSKKVPRAQNTLVQKPRFKLFQPRSDLSCPSRKQLWTGTSGTNCSPPFLPTTKAPTFIICNRWRLSAIYQTPALSDPDCTVQFPQHWPCAQTLVGAGDMAVAALQRTQVWFAALTFLSHAAYNSGTRRLSPLLASTGNCSLLLCCYNGASKCPVSTEWY